MVWVKLIAGWSIDVRTSRYTHTHRDMLWGKVFFKKKIKEKLNVCTALKKLN